MGESVLPVPLSLWLEYSDPGPFLTRGAVVTDVPLCGVWTPSDATVVRSIRSSEVTCASMLVSGACYQTGFNCPAVLVWCFYDWITRCEKLCGAVYEDSIIGPILYKPFFVLFYVAGYVGAMTQAFNWRRVWGLSVALLLGNIWFTNLKKPLLKSYFSDTKNYVQKTWNIKVLDLTNRL